MRHDVLADVYARYWRKLVLYVYSICRDLPLAEDVAQEAFVKAVLALPDGSVDFAGWLYKVARNLCLNELKRRGRLTRFGEGEMEATGGDEESVLDKVVADEERAALTEAIEGLPGKAREVIALHYFADIPLGRVAELVGISYANARVIAMRARERLRTYLEKKI